MIVRRRRGAEGTSVLRVRLIASILVAALLPFLTAWWIATFPGLAIFAVVLGFNLLGDALRDLFDPRRRKE